MSTTYTNEQEQWINIGSLTDRMTAAESKIDFLNKFITQVNTVLNNQIDGLIPLQKKVDDLTRITSNNSSSINDLRTFTRDIDSRLQATQGSIAGMQNQITRINQDLHSVYNADLFTFNQLLDVERFVNAPKATQDALMAAINNTVGGVGVTDTALADYLKTPNTMNAPYTQPPDTSADWWGNLLGSFAGGALTGFGTTALLIGGGLLLVLALSNRK